MTPFVATVLPPAKDQSVIFVCIFCPELRDEEAQGVPVQHEEDTKACLGQHKSTELGEVIIMIDYGVQITCNLGLYVGRQILTYNLRTRE